MIERMSDAHATGKTKGKVRAWDLPTRLFHWLLAALVLLAWASWRYGEALGDLTLKIHRWNGQAILVLVVWRVLWGFVGSSTSRFSAWLWWPWTAIAYAFQILRGRTPLYLSHNPLGSYMILALLAAVAVQAVSGLLAVEHNDLTAGPLYRLVSEETQKAVTTWHTSFFYWWVFVLVSIHVLANVLVRARREGAAHHRHDHRPQAGSSLSRRARGDDRRATDAARASRASSWRRPWCSG